MARSSAFVHQALLLRPVHSNLSGKESPSLNTSAFIGNNLPTRRHYFRFVRHPPDESHCGRRARTYRERTFRWSTVSVPMESFSMRASRIRKRPMAIAPTAIAPIAAAPRANAPTASARAVLPVSIASVALFVWVIGPFSFHLVSCRDYR
jgi:hypothetical protein